MPGARHIKCTENALKLKINKAEWSFGKKIKRSSQSFFNTDLTIYELFGLARLASGAVLVSTSRYCATWNSEMQRGRNVKVRIIKYVMDSMNLETQSFMY